ncbi:MAG: hypothetical protein ChlgKO_01620 [Chlamydiales bacterium]
MDFATVGLTAFQGRIDSFLLGETKTLSKRNIPMVLGAIAATFFAASIVRCLRTEAVEPLIEKHVSSYPSIKNLFEKYIKEPQFNLTPSNPDDIELEDELKRAEFPKAAASFLSGLQVVAVLVTLSTSGTTKKIAFYTNLFFGTASYAISPRLNSRSTYIQMGVLGTLGLGASELWMRKHV